MLQHTPYRHNQQHTQRHTQHQSFQLKNGHSITPEKMTLEQIQQAFDVAFHRDPDCGGHCTLNHLQELQLLLESIKTGAPIAITATGFDETARSQTLSKIEELKAGLNELAHVVEG